MSIKMKNFVKNNEAKALSWTIIILMMTAILTSIFISFPLNDRIASGASTSQFLYYKEITLNSSQVPATMTNFSVCINLSSDTDLASDVLDSGYDIAFFNESDVQLNHEIEYFNGSTGRLVAWVNITTLESGSDTTIYMYYGDSDIGSSAENITGTWNSDYVMVHHFHETPDDGSSFNDSTSNNNDGVWNDPTSQGDNNKSGLFYNCVQFEDANIDNFINLSSQSGFYSASLWINCPVRNSYDFLFAHNDFRIYYFSDGEVRASDGNDNTINSAWDIDSHYDEWIHLVLVSNGSDSYLYINNVEYGSTDTFGSVDTNETNLGRWVVDTHYGDNIMEEVQVFTSKLTANQVAFIYNSQKNATDGGFFSLGTETGLGATVTITELDSNGRITFGSGEANEVLWNNATGNWGAGAMMNLSINASDPHIIDEICINLSDTDAGNVHWENISCEVSVDNISWDGTCYDFSNGMNLSLNASWSNGYCHGTTPFPISSDDYILIRFKLTCPSDASTGSHQTATTACKIQWLGS